MGFSVLFGLVLSCPLQNQAYAKYCIGLGLLSLAQGAAFFSLGYEISEMGDWVEGAGDNRGRTRRIIEGRELRALGRSAIKSSIASEISYFHSWTWKVWHSNAQVVK